MRNQTPRERNINKLNEIWNGKDKKKTESNLEKKQTKTDYKPHKILDFFLDHEQVNG